MEFIATNLDATNIDIGFDEDAYYKWIRSNFYIPVCHYYVLNSKTSMCMCGNPREKHVKLTTVLPCSTVWNPVDHCISVPTNAFGTISFINEDSITMPKFVRVGTSSTTENAKHTIPERNIGAIKSLLLDHWKLTAPGLLISVTGGAKSFRLNKLMTANFQQGLMKAAKATNAWVVTGGENCGVMSLVGEAVSLSAFTSSIVTIGVANWGKTLYRDMLLNEYAGEDLIVDYKTAASIKGESSLNSHHTHFFLVDDGYPHKAGCEIRYRMELQDIIQEMSVHEGEALPKVCLLLEGGETSIDCALNTVEYNNPLVIVKNTGRAADIICHALVHSEEYEELVGGRIITKRRLKESMIRQIKLMIEKDFHRYGGAICDRIFTKVTKIVTCYDMCSIYDTDDEDGLDFAILLALIGRFHDSGAATRQMKLAVLWNQPLVAKEYILSNHTFKASQLNDFLDMSIDYQSVEFIRLLLYEGADLKEYLSIGRLTDLYNDFPEESVLHKALFRGKDEIRLVQVGMLIEKILEGKYSSPFRELDNRDQDMEETFSDPYDQMVVYAALRGDFDMAILFWEFSKAPTMCALVAYKIFRHLVEAEEKSIQTDSDVIRKMELAASTFEEHAIGVMNQCSTRYSRKHLLMFLTVPRSGFSSISIVSMAASLGARRFVAHHAYQSYLTDIWMGVIQHSTSNSLLLLCCIPPLPLLINVFNKRLMSKEEASVHMEEKEKRQVKNMKKRSITKRITVAVQMPLRSSKKKKRFGDDDLRSLTSSERFMGFYNSPIIKFFLYAIFYIIFLCVYAYSLLIHHNNNALSTLNRVCHPYQEHDYHKYMTCLGDNEEFYGRRHSVEYTDIVLFICIISTIPVEIDQILGETPIRFTSKLKNHYSSTYDVVDLSAMLLFQFAFILKIYSPEWNANPASLWDGFNIGRLCNIVSLGCYTFRFVQLFEINANLGPKINMIKKMLRDLYFFIFILIVFLIGYAVATEALINPLRTEPEVAGMRILSLFSRSFFNVFGEINVDGLNEDFLKYHCEQLLRYDQSVYYSSPTLEVLYPEFTEYLMQHRGFADVSGCATMPVTRLFGDNDLPFIELSYTITYFLLCCYLLFSNVMLINLLIAIFSSTYERVEEESDTVFKFQRESIITEFQGRAPLPNPFCIIFYVSKLFKWLFKEFRMRKTQKKETVDPEVEYKVGLIEAECRGLFKKDTEDELHKEHRLMNELKKTQNRTDNEVKKIRMLVEDMSRDMMLDKKNKITPVVEMWKRVFSHKYSRHSPYPDTQIDRFPVPDNRIKWDIVYPEYSAPYYDNPLSDMFGESSDPYSITEFNMDKNGINRKSSVSDYLIMDGKPLNPKGRTGLCGRGQLERWGPNHLTVSLISRWALDKEGKNIKMNSMSVIQMVAIRRKGCELWDLPSGYINVGETISAAHKRNFLTCTLGMDTVTGVDKLRLLQDIDRWTQTGIILYKGYFDDACNTDNAWMEKHAVNYHLEEGPYPDNFMPGSLIDEVSWLTLDDKAFMSKGNLWMLKKACIHVGAYNPYKGEILL